MWTSLPSEDPLPMGMLGRMPKRTGEDESDLLGPADVDVLLDEGLKEAPCPARVVEDHVRETSIWRIDSS